MDVNYRDLVEYTVNQRKLLEDAENKGLNLDLLLNPDLSGSELKMRYDLLLYGVPEELILEQPINSLSKYLLLTQGGCNIAIPEKAPRKISNSLFGNYVAALCNHFHKNVLHLNTFLSQPEKLLSLCYPGIEPTPLTNVEYNSIGETFDTQMTKICEYLKTLNRFPKLSKNDFNYDEMVLIMESTEQDTSYLYRLYDKYKQYGTAEELETFRSNVVNEFKLRGRLNISLDERYPLKVRGSMIGKYYTSGIDVRILKEKYSELTPEKQALYRERSNYLRHKKKDVNVDLTL